MAEFAISVGIEWKLWLHAKETMPICCTNDTIDTSDTIGWYLSGLWVMRDYYRVCMQKEEDLRFEPFSRAAKKHMLVG